MMSLLPTSHHLIGDGTNHRIQKWVLTGPTAALLQPHMSPCVHAPSCAVFSHKVAPLGVYPSNQISLWSTVLCMFAVHCGTLYNVKIHIYDCPTRVSLMLPGDHLQGNFCLAFLFLSFAPLLPPWSPSCCLTPLPPSHPVSAAARPGQAARCCCWPLKARLPGAVQSRSRLQSRPSRWRLRQQRPASHPLAPPSRTRCGGLGDPWRRE